MTISLSDRTQLFCYEWAPVSRTRGSEARGENFAPNTKGAKTFMD